jgi:hypothetical protein
MTECSCNVCTVEECTRKPKKAVPILALGTYREPIPKTQGECLCNECEILDCLRHPKKATPIIKEEVVYREKIIIKEREPCPKRCPNPLRGEIRVTAYAVSPPFPNSTPVYMSKSPCQSPIVTTLYGISSGRSIMSTKSDTTTYINDLSKLSGSSSTTTTKSKKGLFSKNCSYESKTD